MTRRVSSCPWRWVRVATWVVGTGLLVTSLALGLGGCSMMLSQPPPANAPVRYGSECSDSYLPVIGDVYLATNTGGVAVLAFAAAAIQRENANNNVAPSWEAGKRTDSAVPGLVAVGMISTLATVGAIQSARYGARSADACASARQALITRWPPPSPFPHPPAPN